MKRHPETVLPTDRTLNADYARSQERNRKRLEDIERLEAEHAAAVASREVEEGYDFFGMRRRVK